VADSDHHDSKIFTIMNVITDNGFVGYQFIIPKLNIDFSSTIDYHSFSGHFMSFLVVQTGMYSILSYYSDGQTVYYYNSE